MKKKCVIIIGEDEGLNKMLAYYLASVDYTCSLFESVQDYRENGRDVQPLAFIIDVKPMDNTAYDFLRALREDTSTSDMPFLLLAQQASEVERINALELGADEFLLKPFSVKELAARLRNVLRRAGGFIKSDKNAVIEYRDITINVRGRIVTVGDRTVDLTYKEFELLRYLLQNRGRVLDRGTLLRSIWGYEFSGETRTVDMHVKSLRQKLGDDYEHPKYIVTVRGVGYKVENKE